MQRCAHKRNAQLSQQQKPMWHVPSITHFLYFLYNFHVDFFLFIFCSLALLGFHSFGGSCVTHAFFFILCLKRCPSVSLSMHFVFAFMFHLFLSPLLLFGIVDAGAATMNPIQIFRLNDWRCNVTPFFSSSSSSSLSFFCVHSVLFAFMLCHRAVVGCLARSIDVTLCVRLFFLCRFYLGIFPIFIGVFAVFSHSFSALWKNMPRMAFVSRSCFVRFFLLCIG